jgi:hypothetical protein
MVSLYSNLIEARAFLVSVLTYKPCHIALKYRRLHKTSVRLRPAYLIAIECECVQSNRQTVCT